MKEVVENDTNVYGSCVYQDSHIELRKGLSKERLEQTLVHEMLHAVFFEAGYAGEDYEDIVNRTSVILHQTLKQNDLPKIFEQAAGLNYGGK